MPTAHMCIRSLGCCVRRRACGASCAWRWPAWCAQCSASRRHLGSPPRREQRGDGAAARRQRRRRSAARAPWPPGRRGRPQRLRRRAEKWCLRADIWTYLDGHVCAGRAAQAAERAGGQRSPGDRGQSARPQRRHGRRRARTRSPPPRACADGAAGDRSPSQSEPAPADAAAAAVPQPRPRPVAAPKQPQRSARSQARRREPAGGDARAWREVRSDDWAAPGYYPRAGFQEGFFSFFR